MAFFNHFRETAWCKNPVTHMKVCGPPPLKIGGVHGQGDTGKSIYRRTWSYRMWVNMPNQKEHCAHTLSLYGVEGRDIHSWIDSPVKIVGPTHQRFRHTKGMVAEVIKIFGESYDGDAQLIENIVLDHLSMDRDFSRLTEGQKEKISDFFSELGNWTAQKQYDFARSLGITTWKLSHYRRKHLSIERVCIPCGKRFTSHRLTLKRWGTLFCSKECHYDFVHPLIECPSCGKRFRKGPKTKYCSRECSDVGAAEAEKLRRKEREYTLVCKHCKDGFTHNHKNKKYCSPECRYDASHPEVVCQNCGIRFRVMESIKDTRKFCDWKCRNEYFSKQKNDDVYKEMIQERKKILLKNEELKKEKVCPVCGVTFYAAQDYCSGACKKEGICRKNIKSRTHPCLNCGESTSRRRFCCDGCGHVYSNENRSNGRCRDCGRSIEKKSTRCSGCYGIFLAKKVEEGEKQGNWSFATRVFAKAICNLRDIDREAYLKMRNSLTREQKIKFDRILSKFYTKFYGDSYRAAKKRLKE